MENIQTIVDRFGGLTAMAKALGHKNPTTVQGWRDNNRIPHWRHHEVKMAAKRKRIDLSDTQVIADK